MVDFVMSLQKQAARAGGKVGAILGNHDVLILAVLHFSLNEKKAYGSDVFQTWILNGGQISDLERLRADHVAWLSSLPALARVRNILLAHADSSFYLRYGNSIGTINAAIKRVLRQTKYEQKWDELFSEFCRRNEFGDRHGDGVHQAQAFLATFNAKQLIHGHTPISKVTGVEDEHVTQALTYAKGLCVNVDGGIYRGGPGFVYEVPSGT